MYGWSRLDTRAIFQINWMQVQMYELNGWCDGGESIGAAVASLIYGDFLCCTTQLRTLLSDLKVALAAIFLVPDTSFLRDIIFITRTRNSVFISNLSVRETMHHDIEEVKVMEKMKQNKAKNTRVQSSGLNRMPRGSSAEERKGPTDLVPFQGN